MRCSMQANCWGDARPEGPGAGDGARHVVRPVHKGTRRDCLDQVGDPERGDATGSSLQRRRGRTTAMAQSLYHFYRLALPSLNNEPQGTMPRSLYGYVIKVSARQQVRLALLTLIIFPLASVPLEFQRRIIDHAVTGADAGLLFLFGGLYLGVLVLQGSLKFVRDIYLNRIAEGVARLLRKRFVHGERPDVIEEGTKQAILASESERVGGFVAESISLPMLQIGTMLSIAIYMITVDPLIAAVAIAFLTPSIIVVALAQPVLNGLSETKISAVRELGENVLQDGRNPGSDNAAPDGLIERIYHLRLRFANIKNATKSINSFVNYLGLLCILLVGGWEAIQGRTEIGVIVAFMSGYERMTGPARDLLNFYRRLSMMHVQYALVSEAADAAGPSIR